MSSDHHFNVAIAKDHGLDLSTFLTNLAFLTGNNLANRRNIKYGYCWSYNTLEALAELHPYWTLKQLRDIASRGEKAGLLVKAPLRRSKSDHTNWYALTPDAYKFFPNLHIGTYIKILSDSAQEAQNMTDEKDKSLILLIRRNCPIEETELSLRWDELGASYKTNIKPNTKPNKSSCASRSESPKAQKPKPPMTRSSMKAENEKVQGWEKERREKEAKEAKRTRSTWNPNIWDEPPGHENPRFAEYQKIHSQRLQSQGITNEQRV